LPIDSVCIYCGSAGHVDEIYKKIACEVGIALAKHNMRLVYGGGHVGLMGTVADATLAAGGKVTGIIPEHIRSHELQHTGLTELIVVDNMHTRKSIMAEKSDAFVALPGGFGTLDELFEILTWKQLALHTKPIIIFNVNGFWDPLIALIHHLIDGHFAPENNRQIFKVVTTVDALFAALFAQEDENFDPEDKWR